MEIIIDHNGIKRKIAGEFSLCGSARDLQILVDAIEDRLRGEFNYGWIEIHEPLPGTPNSPPIDWGAKGGNS